MKKSTCLPTIQEEKFLYRQSKDLTRTQIGQPWRKIVGNGVKEGDRARIPKEFPCPRYVKELDPF